ncbi:MAG: SRPBCC domain-containing protein [Odoribacteraceae bacterium]|nr:SRPBCC domain-containing protein [Odoribacteraceae bacterium]
MKNFEYTTEIMADPAEVFAALTNPFQIEVWSGFPAEMKAEEGFLFSLWEGDISGINLKVIPDRLLVQEWFFGDTAEPSIVTIRLKRAADRTRLELTHANIPDEAFDEITEGWENQYIGAIKSMLEMY